MIYRGNRGSFYGKSKSLFFSKHSRMYPQVDSMLQPNVVQSRLIVYCNPTEHTPGSCKRSAGHVDRKQQAVPATCGCGRPGIPPPKDRWSSPSIPKSRLTVAEMVQSRKQLPTCPGDEGALSWPET